MSHMLSIGTIRKKCPLCDCMMPQQLTLGLQLIIILTYLLREKFFIVENKQQKEGKCGNVLP